MEKILEKLCQPRHVLSVSDLTPEEKVRLYALFVSYGATQSFAYDRCFKEGFDAWEIEGIDNIKKSFLSLHDAELSDYQRICALEGTDPGMFYNILGESMGLKKSLKDMMLQKGMSMVTCQKRFMQDDFKSFERIGIKALLEKFVCAEKSL